MGDIINGILNAIKFIYNFITAVGKSIAAIISWASAWFDSLTRDITGLISSLLAYYAAEIDFAKQLFYSILSLVTQTYDNIVNWASNEIQSAINFISRVQQDILTWVMQWINYIEGLLNQLENYIINTFIAPLVNLVSGIVNWIATEGTYIYNLITHPELLAQLIGKYLLAGWLGLTRKYAKPFFTWFYHTGMSLAPDFESILEDIISSLF